MSGKIKILIGDANYLVRQGLRLVFDDAVRYDVVAEAESYDTIFDLVKTSDPDVIVIGLNLPGASAKEVIGQLIIRFPKKKILVIDTVEDKLEIIQILQLGVHGYILKHCDKQEILDAVNSMVNGKNFFCHNVMQFSQDMEEHDRGALSVREIEILKLISNGLTNNEIADKLFLSSHTVATHRKNLMRKLKAKNNVDLVISAIKESIIVP